MKNKLAIFLLAALILSLPIFAANPALHYEPEVVTLSGVIKIKTFPGAPNYESIESGDDTESCPYIILDHPIDVIVSPKDQDPNVELEKNLKIIQIAYQDDSNWDDKYIGNHVHVVGTLYHAITGHHHTHVLIRAKYFELRVK